MVSLPNRGGSVCVSIQSLYEGQYPQLGEPQFPKGLGGLLKELCVRD